MEILTHTQLNGGVLQTVALLDHGIFPSPFDEETFQRELRHRHNLCILVAAVDAVPCAYKIGFEQSPDVFYSFSGGVLPEFRRCGIARQLMERQHDFARALGYSVIRTQTRNKYREMLMLNIACGFDITGVALKSGDKHQSIILEKRLEPAK